MCGRGFDVGVGVGVRGCAEQLPIVLQVLLSQQHRLRALELLERFLSLGSWAVRKALSVGIFPYVFKLLGSPSPALRPVLISLWAKILADDPKCKLDLLKSAAGPVRKGAGPSGAGPADWKAYMYFVATVTDTEQYGGRLRALAAYVLAMFADDHARAQDALIDSGLIERTLPQLTPYGEEGGEDPPEEEEDRVDLRVCLCLMLAKTWGGGSRPCRSCDVLK